jgi:hypothetical protein
VPESVDIGALRREIDRLPDDWHGAGTVSPAVLEALARHASERRLTRSMETGTGRTTLLLSHLSSNHTVFAKDDRGDGDSLIAVQKSHLLNADAVSFVVGPTQSTLLGHKFDEPIELAYLDGPHAYPFPDLEYWAVYPHIERHGLLVIDDIQIPTIANMFRTLKADRMWELVETVEDTAFFRRTEAPAIDPFGEGWWEQGFNRRHTYGHLTLGKRLNLSRLKAEAIRRLRPPAKRLLRRR